MYFRPLRVPSSGICRAVSPSTDQLIVAIAPAHRCKSLGLFSQTPPGLLRRSGPRSPRWALLSDRSRSREAPLELVAGARHACDD